MFETFNISGFYASEQAVLSLYAVGRISGCTVDIGHGKIGIDIWRNGNSRFVWIVSINITYKDALFDLLALHQDVLSECGCIVNLCNIFMWYSGTEGSMGV